MPGSPEGPRKKEKLCNYLSLQIARDMKSCFSKNKSASVYWGFDFQTQILFQSSNKQKHFYFLKNMISLRARFEATGRLQFLPFCGDPPGTLALLKHNKVFFKEFQGHFWFCRSASRVGILFFWPGTLGDPSGPSIRALLLVEVWQNNIISKSYWWQSNKVE